MSQPFMARVPGAGIRRRAGARRRSAANPRRSTRAAVLFLAPFMVFLIVFQYVPIVLLLRNSLFDYTLIDPSAARFVGLHEYARIFSDPIQLGSFAVTLVFAAGVVVLVVPFGFLLALFLNGRFPGRALVRTMVFLPVITSVIVSATMWLFMLTRNGGLVPSALAGLGLTEPDFLGSRPLALISITVMTAWQQVGFGAVLFLSGLQAIPEELLEAAAVDGAPRRRIIMHIVVPLMSRTTLLVVIAMTVFSLQAFAPAFLMTSGGPENSTNLIVFSIYTSAFQLQDPGFASALAVVLMVVALLLSGLQSTVLRTRWRY